MTVQNAIKKVSKWAEVKENNGAYVARKGNKEIEFRGNGWTDDVATIRVRNINDLDEVQSDYSAGVYCDNIAQALRIGN